jgi:hypothetical protein
MLPKKLRIGGRTYKIMSWQAKEAATAGKFAECDKVNKIIRVDESWGEVEAAASLLHEILHAVFEEYVMKPDDDEERTVTTMEKGLIQVIKDNPKLWEYIGESLHG